MLRSRMMALSAVCYSVARRACCWKMSVTRRTQPRLVKPMAEARALSFNCKLSTHSHDQLPSMYRCEDSGLHDALARAMS